MVRDTKHREEHPAGADARQEGSFAPGFRDFYQRHFRFVYRLVARIAEPADVEDLVQEVFTIAGRKLPEFEGRSRETTWLYRIAANVVVADRRKKKRQRLLSLKWLRPEPDELVVDGPDREVERDDARSLVRELLSKMSEKKRDVFVLFELEGFTGQEVAEMVGCPLDTMWTRLFHARRDFRRLLAERGLHSIGDLEQILGVGR